MQQVDLTNSDASNLRQCIVDIDISVRYQYIESYCISWLGI